MIDRQYVIRLEQLERERLELMGQAAVYRLHAFNAIEGFVPPAAKVDSAMMVLRYAREHLWLTGSLLVAAAFFLRKRIGLLGMLPAALRIGNLLLAR